MKFRIDCPRVGEVTTTEQPTYIAAMGTKTVTRLFRKPTFTSAYCILVKQPYDACGRYTLLTHFDTYEEQKAFMDNVQACYVANNPRDYVALMHIETLDGAYLPEPQRDALRCAKNILRQTAL